MKNIEKKLIKRINKINDALNEDTSRNKKEWTLQVSSYAFMFHKDGVKIEIKLELFNSLTGEVEFHKISFDADSSIEYIRGVFSTIINYLE